MKIYNVEQGSQEWHDLRRGRPTASEFGRIMTPVKRKLSSSCEEYIDELLGAKLDPHYPHRAESYTSRAMDRGHEVENEARMWYAMLLPPEERVHQVGFVTTDDDRFGCSPDAMIYVGDSPVRGLELKCPEAKTQMARARGPKTIPADMLPQIHGGMIVTGLKSWDWLSYCEVKPELSVLVRVTPDDFTMSLRVALELFDMKYKEAIERIKNLS